MIPSSCSLTDNRQGPPPAQRSSARVSYSKTSSPAQRCNLLQPVRQRHTYVDSSQRNDFCAVLLIPHLDPSCLTTSVITVDAATNLHQFRALSNVIVHHLRSHLKCLCMYINQRGIIYYSFGGARLHTFDSEYSNCPQGSWSLYRRMRYPIRPQRW